MDSSDDGNSSSDDELLLASPVFNKSKRRVIPVDRGAARIEKNKLDFLQSCLQGSDARTDVQRRLNEIDEEFGLRDTTAAVASNKEEEKKEEEADDNNGEGVSMNVNNGKLTPKCTNDSTTSNSKESNDQSSQRPSSSHNELATKKKQEEEAYWAKIDTFVETNASSASISRKTHSARRKLNDAISGLTGYASSDDEGGGNGHNENDDITDDEGGRWRDGCCGMTRERLRSEAEAKSRGSSSHIGLRKMFFSPPILFNTPRDHLSPPDTTATTTGKMDNFQTRQEAYNELKSIIVTLHNSHCTPQTPSEKVLRKLFIDPFAQIMKQHTDDIKWDNIHNLLLNNPLLLGRYGIVLPQVFCHWLWKMACSSFDTVGRHISTTCCNMIRKFLSKRMDELEEKVVYDDTTTILPPSSLTFCVDMSFLDNYYMNDLISCLVKNYGLWLDDGPMPTIHETNDKLTNNDNTTTTINNKKKNNSERFIRVDVCTLKNIFILWSVLLDRNLIRIQDTDDKEDENNVLLFGKDASRLLVAFARVSLDPSFNDANMKYDTFGEPLIAVIHKLMSSLIMSATYQIMKQFINNDGGKHVEQWMGYTSDLLVKACSNLKAGDDGATYCDDKHGELALAMSVVRMCSYNTVDTGFSIDIAAMKMKFAEKALHKCLFLADIDWEEKVAARNNPSVDVNLHLAIHALLTAEIAFEYIHEESESMMQSHPHFLASVLIAGECAMIGASVYWRFWNDSQSEDELGMQQLTEESDTVYEIVSNIEDLCDELKKECRAVIAYPHLRRTKEYLTRLAKEFGALKGRSSKDKGVKRRGQCILDNYFSSRRSDPFTESQDS